MIFILQPRKSQCSDSLLCLCRPGLLGWVVCCSGWPLAHVRTAWDDLRSFPTPPPPPCSAKRAKAGSTGTWKTLRNSINQFCPWNIDLCACSHQLFNSGFGSSLREFPKNYSHRPLKDRSALRISINLKGPMKNNHEKKENGDSTKAWLDWLCWFHEVIWMMEDMPPQKQSHLAKWRNKPTHSSHDHHASSQECNFPLFRIIHFLFNRSRLIYLDLASDQVPCCIWWGGERRSEKNKRELYVKYGDPALKLQSTWVRNCTTSLILFMLREEYRASLCLYTWKNNERYAWKYRLMNNAFACVMVRKYHNVHFTTRPRRIFKKKTPL